MMVVRLEGRVHFSLPLCAPSSSEQLWDLPYVARSLTLMPRRYTRRDIGETPIDRFRHDFQPKPKCAYTKFCHYYELTQKKYLKRYHHKTKLKLKENGPPPTLSWYCGLVYSTIERKRDPAGFPLSFRKWAQPPKSSRSPPDISGEPS